MRSNVVKAGLDCSIRVMVSRTIIGNIRFSVLGLRVGQHMSQSSCGTRRVRTCVAENCCEKAVLAF